METALFITTFAAGFFLGIIALGGTLAILVRRYERKQKNLYLEAIDRGRAGYEPRERVGPNPFE